ATPGGEVEMRTSRSSRRRLVRAVALGVALGAVMLVVGSFPFASGASVGPADSVLAAVTGYPHKEADQMWYYQRFLVSGQADMDRLVQMGVDLGESLDKNADGTMWAYAVVTAAQRDYLDRLGFRPGNVIQTEADAVRAQAEMAHTARMEQRA